MFLGFAPGSKTMPPRRRRRKPAGPEPEGRELSDIDEGIERGIDAVDGLRVEMRKAGMAACADALDEAFVKCLREYVTRKQGVTPDKVPNGTSRQRKKLN